MRGGIVALHGASSGARDQPLFAHLAATLAPHGVAVLTYDRRTPPRSDEDTPVEVQAEDALAAMVALRDRLGVPSGVYGFSQGAWAAMQAAAGEPDVAWLIVVGWSAVSPAVQMRFFTDESLRRRGFADPARAQLRDLRLLMEGHLRGRVPRAEMDAALSTASQQPWFAHAYLPPRLPPDGLEWPDMDLDPTEPLADVTCPVLAVWGEQEECVPPAPGIAALRGAALSDVTTVLLPGCGHAPWIGSGVPDAASDAASFSPVYARALVDWLDHRL